MSWVATAIIGTGVVNAVVSNKASKRATGASEKASAEQLEFDRQRYEDWLAVYGPIQDNLSDYYMNITPDYYEVQGLEAFEKEKADVLANVNEMLAQRGITSSGLAAETLAQIELGAAQERSRIRADAPRKAAQEQLGFLQVGLGQNPAGDVASTLAQQTAFSQQQAGLAQQSAAQATGQLVSSVGTALVDYNRSQSPGLK